MTTKGRQAVFPKWMHRLRSRPLNHQQGFTLTELLVGAILGAVVILVAWSGLITAMSVSQAAEARSARQVELNRAIDFITNEVRMARAVNESATLKANGTTVSLADVATSAGVNLSNLGSYGTISLYLERDTSPNIPSICPAGGPNAGAVPPAPAAFDPIIYDVRPSPSGWLKPKMLARYGRVPNGDGTINPCSTPVSSDPMIDALSTTMKNTPTCSGLLSGDGGFYSCVEGKQVNLFIQSDVSNVEAKQVNSAVSSRILDIQSQPIESSGCAGESQLRSKSSDTPSHLTFSNQKSTPIKLYWLDFAGARVYYQDLAPGEVTTMNSFITHPWVITDPSQVCLGIFVADTESGAITMQ
ncbi:MAG TPA: prepilin-type N-terminal cleavage/methylation domain-containing protein [Stenomitos sp.]